MSKSVLSEVSGFTPVFDSVLRDVGPTGAIVFGVMWRYCQMKDGVCKASHQTISERSSLSLRAVNTYVAKLVEAGYLKDHNPNLRGAPHSYSDTGKAGMRITISGEEITQLAEDANHVQNMHLTYAPGAHKETSKKEFTKSSDEFYQEETQEFSEEETPEFQKRPVPIHTDPRRAHLLKTLHDSLGLPKYARFPSDVRPFATAVSIFWKLDIPQSKFTFWLKGARELKEACGDHGVALVLELVGKNTFVSSPRSLVSSANAEVARIRRLSDGYFKTDYANYDPMREPGTQPDEPILGFVLNSKTNKLEKP
jgi:hypothetical protein